jgi:uncharacterized protein
VSASLYVDTSALLRVVIEVGLSPELEAGIDEAAYLTTSRLTHVEASRALLRLGSLDEAGKAESSRRAEVEEDVRALLRRCVVLEISEAVCELASSVSPERPIRALDALHLATYLLARQDVTELELVTEDQRLRAALEGLPQA